MFIPILFYDEDRDGTRFVIEWNREDSFNALLTRTVVYMYMYTSHTALAWDVLELKTYSNKLMPSSYAYSDLIMIY